MHLDAGQVGEDRRHVGQRRPVVLDVLARREMAVALVVFAGDVAEHPQLPRVQRAVGDGDAQHIGVQLQIDAVHQPQRPELVLGDLAGKPPVHLVAELARRGHSRNPGRTHRSGTLSSFRPPAAAFVMPAAGRSRDGACLPRSLRLVGPAARMRSRKPRRHDLAVDQFHVDQVDVDHLVVRR